MKLPSSGVPGTRRTWTCSVGPEQDHENNERAGTPSYKNRLRELGWFGPEKRRLGADIVAAFQYMREAFKKCGRDFLPGPVVTGQGAMILNWKSIGLVWT